MTVSASVVFFAAVEDNKSEAVMVSVSVVFLDVVVEDVSEAVTVSVSVAFFVPDVDTES